MWKLQKLANVAFAVIDKYEKRKMGFDRSEER